MHKNIHRQVSMLLLMGALLLHGCAAPSHGTASGAPSIPERKSSVTYKADPDDETDMEEAEPEETKVKPITPPKATSTSTETTIDPDVLDYFLDVAMGGFEFGSAPAVAYKWTSDIRVAATGSPSEQDLATLDTIISELGALIDPVEINRVESGGNITIYFGPDSEFSRQVAGYTPGNRGYFSVQYGGSYAIRSAKILISTEVDKQARAHLVREELTQSMGLFRDSWTYKASIFYQGWTTTNSYAQVDKAIIKLLYDPRIKPGMNKTQVRAALGA